MSKKTPQIRFKGFTDDWEERKLKDVVEKQIKGKAQFEKLAPGDVEYLDTSRLNGGQAILTNGFKDVKLDDVLILWDGSKAGTVYHGFEGSLGSTLKAYRTSADSKFVYQYLKRHQDNIYNNYRTPNIPHVQKDFLDVFTISVPRIDEQAKIGSFFNQIDNTIALHQRKLELLKEQKKGFLQKMFPKNGARVPELRFAGFADDWDQRKLLDNVDKVLDYRGKSPTKFGMEWGTEGYLVLSALNVKNGYIDKSVEAKYGNQELFEKWMGRSKLEKGDVLFTTEAPLGNVAQVPDGNGYILNQRVVAFKSLKKTDDNFFAQLLRSPIVQNTLKANSSGGTAKGIGMKEFAKLNASVPQKIEEQKKIGSFFKQLDDTIALHQRKLDLLKEQKKGFLQKMFVS